MFIYTSSKHRIEDQIPISSTWIPQTLLPQSLLVLEDEDLIVENAGGWLLNDDEGSSFLCFQRLSPFLAQRSLPFEVHMLSVQGYGRSGWNQ